MQTSDATNLANINSQQKMITQGNLESLLVYSPMCIDHCEALCNNYCTCTECNVQATFHLAPSATYGNYMTIEHMVAIRSYIAKRSNMEDIYVDVQVTNGKYNSKTGLPRPLEAPIVSMDVVMTIWSKNMTASHLVRMDLINNLEDISNQMATLTERDSVFVQKVEGGNAPGGSDSGSSSGSSGSSGGSGGGGGGSGSSGSSDNNSGDFINPNKDSTRPTTPTTPTTTTTVSPDPSPDDVSPDVVSPITTPSSADGEDNTSLIVVTVVIVLVSLLAIVVFVVAVNKRKKQSNFIGGTKLDEESTEMTLTNNGSSTKKNNRKERLQQMNHKIKKQNESYDNPLNVLNGERVVHAAVAVTVEVGPLPKGWEIATDEEGDEYFYNHDLGESRW